MNITSFSSVPNTVRKVYRFSFILYHLAKRKTRFSFLVQKGADWRKVHTGVLLSGYINDTHTYVPGPDGKFGYGGKCFHKDGNAA